MGVAAVFIEILTGL